MADSHISLNANRIDIEAGRSDSKEKSRGQNVGAEVGVFVQAGAQYGVGVYATLGGGSNKADGHSTIYHNSHLDSETVSINSQGDTTLRGAQAKGKTVNVNAGGDLNIESLQDEAEFKSRGSQAGVHVQFGIGNAWSANANASAERGTTSRKQVNEQSGIFAEEGGYHVNADNVQLKGGVISSTNAQNSELATNKFSFEDIENHSESSAVSGSISGGYNHTTRTPSLSPGMPMYQHSQDSTTTKSVLTEGKITLNKDSQPTQTTATELGIQTSLENANNQVAQTENVQKQLAEQKEIREAINNVQSAVNTYTANQATEALEKAKTLEQELAQAKAEGDNQKISEKTTALLSSQADAEAWQLGGSKKRTVDTVTAIITTALAGKTGAEIAVAASSPSINEFIHEKTKDNKATNLLAHAVLSATEFYVAGQDPLTGALAGVAGEGTAMLLAEKVFNKKPAELSAEEKETLRIASMLAGGLVGAVGNSSTSNNHGANGLASATEGMTTAKRAVENNFLSDASRKRLNALVDRLLRKERLTIAEQDEIIELFQRDQISDALLAKALKGEKLNQVEEQRLNDYIQMYVTESRKGQTQSGHRLVAPKSAYWVSREFRENYLSGDYEKPYDFPFAGTNNQKNMAVDALPEDKVIYLWSYPFRNEPHSPEEDAYYVLASNRSVRDELPKTWQDYVEIALNLIVESRGGKNGASRLNKKPGNSVQTTHLPHTQGKAGKPIIQGDNTYLVTEIKREINKTHYPVGDNGKIDYSSSGFDYKRRLVGDSDYDIPKKQTETATANPPDSKPKSSGAENVALYPKLKEDLARREKESYERNIRDLGYKPEGSVVMLPDYRQQLADIKLSLPKHLQKQGNAAIARIDIEGIETKVLAGHSQIDFPQGAFAGKGQTQFNSLSLPARDGKLIDRKTDSEYKIFSNLADQLGSNTQAKGRVTIFTERPACTSCLGVADQFKKRYPNIDVYIFDNNSKIINPKKDK